MSVISSDHALSIADFDIKVSRCVVFAEIRGTNAQCTENRYGSETKYRHNCRFAISPYIVHRGRCLKVRIRQL